MSKPETSAIGKAKKKLLVGRKTAKNVTTATTNSSKDGIQPHSGEPFPFGIALTTQSTTLEFLLSK